MSTYTSSTNQIDRLTRLEQLTLNTWRWAAVSLRNTLDPAAVLELAALHAVLASLRNLDNPVALFNRHSQANPEFKLIVSVLPDDHHPALAHDILDAAFLLHWTELTAGGAAPQELPPLRRRQPGVSRSEK